MTPSDRLQRRDRQRIAPLVAAAAAIALVGCGEGVPAIDTSAAEAQLDALAASSSEVLTTCPIADVDILLEQIFTDVDDDLVEAALVNDTGATITDDDATLVCERVDVASGGSVAIQLSDSPGDGLINPDTAPIEIDIAAQWASVAEAYAVRAGDVPPELATDELQDTRGGVLYEICLTDPDDERRDRCELAWFGGDLVVSIVAAGPGAGTIDLGAAVDPFRRRLQLIVDGFTTP